MRRSLQPVWYRAVIGLWCLWFTAVLIGPTGLDACPVHGNASGHAHAGTHGHAMASSHGSGDGEHLAHTSAPSNSPHNSHASCTCLGACCCTPAAALAAHAAGLLPALGIEAELTQFANIAAPASRPPHSHPFANGPPVQS